MPATAQILVAGILYSQPNLLKKVDEMRAPYKAVRFTKTELKKARADLAIRKPELDAWVKSLHTGAKAYLGDQNPELVKFGFKPDKRHRTLTTEEKSAKAERARLTRELRHTMGAKQKREIKAGEPPVPPPPPSPVNPAAGNTH